MARKDLPKYTVPSLTPEEGAQVAAILQERLAMYRKLRGEAERAGTAAGHDAFYESYVRFVDLVSEGALGGGRFAGRKP